MNVVRLWRESPCSTILGEQGHGAGARNESKHALLNMDSVAFRSLAARSVPFVAKSKDDDEIDKIRGRIANLSDGKRRKLTARNMLCKQLVNDSSSSGVALDDDAWQVCQGIVHTHNAKFDALGSDAKLMLFEEALQDDVRHVAGDRLRCEELKRTLAMMESRQRQVALSHGIANTVGAMRLTDKELEELADNYNGTGFRGSSLETECRSLVSSPIVTSAAMQDEFCNIKDQLDETAVHTPKPWWVRRVAERRDRFENVAFSFDPEHATIYVFLYAKLQPAYATFLKATAVGRELPNFEEMHVGETNFDAWRMTYRYTTLDYVLDEDIPVDPDQDCFAITGVVFKDGIVETRHRWHPFDEYLASLPRPPRQARATTTVTVGVQKCLRAC